MKSGRRVTLLWLPILLVTALCLVIPGAIILGQRHPAGPILVSGIGSLIAFLVFWVFLGGLDALLSAPSATNVLVGLIALFGGMLLLLTAWILTLNAATQAHRWGWVALLILAGEVSVAALLISIFRPDPCMFDTPSIADSFTADCTTPNPAAQLLTVAGYLTGPVAAMVYSLRAPSPRRRQGPPEGLTIAPLGAASEADTEAEMHSEPL